MPGCVGNRETDDLSIRTASVTDLAGISTVENASFARDAYPTFLLEKLVLDPQATFLVLADKAQRIIGYCVSRMDSTHSHLISVAVLPDHRRCGAASKMLKELLATSVQRGIREISLEVRTDNVSAIQLYRRFGFTDLGVTPNYYSDGSPALKMRKIVD